MKKLLAFFAFIGLLLPCSHAADFIAIRSEGSCSEYTLHLSGTLSGCWDVKIDAPGSIYDGQWKNSFFYAKDAFCNGTGTALFHFSEKGNISALVKLRQNNSEFRTSLFIEQRCDQENNDVFIPSIAAMVLIALGIAWARR